MEDGVDPAVLRELQLVGKGADALGGSEGAKVLVRELATGLASDRDLELQLELEEDLLTNVKNALSGMSISLLLETVLGTLKLGAQHLSVCGPVQVTARRAGGQLVAEGE